MWLDWNHCHELHPNWSWWLSNCPQSLILWCILALIMSIFFEACSLRNYRSRALFLFLLFLILCEHRCRMWNFGHGRGIRMKNLLCLLRKRCIRFLYVVFGLITEGDRSFFSLHLFGKYYSIELVWCCPILVLQVVHWLHHFFAMSMLLFFTWKYYSVI